MNECVFCAKRGEEVIYTDQICRVILVNDSYYPGYLQLISNQHLKELTDLPKENSLHIFEIILKLELALRKIYTPDKVNLASFGNMVPHLHFHIIPRFVGDRHFPNSIWGEVTNPDYSPSSYLLEKLRDLRELNL